jgi:hypothetical protein
MFREVVSMNHPGDVKKQGAELAPCQITCFDVVGGWHSAFQLSLDSSEAIGQWFEFFVYVVRTPAVREHRLAGRHSGLWTPGF